MSDNNPKSSTVIAIITTVGVLGGAIFSNWQNITQNWPFNSGPTTTAIPTSKATATSTNISDKNLLGTWGSEISCKDKNSEMVMAQRGTIKYLRNKGINEDGEISLELNHEGLDYKLIHTFQSTGEWILEENKLVEKTIDVKFSPKTLKVDTIEFDLQKIDQKELSKFFKDNDPSGMASELLKVKLEDYMPPKGISSESTILKINENIMSVKQENPCEEEGEVTTRYEKKGEELGFLPQTYSFGNKNEKSGVSKSRG